MRIEGKTKEERLKCFADTYTWVKNSLKQEIMRMDECMKQYKGDASVGIQNNAEIPTVTRNITYELIESQIDSNIPGARVEAAKYSRTRERNAKSIERLCMRMRDRLTFEEFNDMEERYSYIFGGSVWLVEWDESLRTYTESGGIRVSIISPQDFFPQPNIYRTEDLDYCFVRFTTTKAALVRQYGLKYAELDGASLEREADASNELKKEDEEDTVTVISCYYKDEDSGTVGRFIWSGDAVLSDMPDYYARRVKKCKTCGRVEALCRCESPDLEEERMEFETLYKNIPLSYKKEDGTQAFISKDSPVVLDGGKVKTVKKNTVEKVDGEVMRGPDGLPITKEEDEAVLEPTRLPYYRPKTIPIVVRRNTSQDKRMLGQSDCEFIRPQQVEINKLETRIQQKLMRSGITPFMPEDATITLNNAVFGNVIKMREGENGSQYGVIDMQPSISQDVAQSERLYDHAKRIIGVSDSYQGHADTTAKSGIAKQAQIAQAAGRMESKRRMKQAAYPKIDRIIFEYYLAYADEPRPVTYVDEFGIRHNDAFNRYDFYEYDEYAGEWYIDDDYLFSADASGAVEGDRQTMWEVNLTNLQQGAFGNPQDMNTLLLYWLKQEKQHYPHAHENVEYFRAMIRAQAQAQAQAQAEPPAPENEMQEGAQAV